MRSQEARLHDILEAIERIEKYAAQGRDAFEQDELIQVWLLYHLQVLGEAVNALAPHLQARYPELPWGQIIGMRNILVHQYFGIDHDAVWSAVERDLPDLKQQVQVILSTWCDEVQR